MESSEWTGSTWAAAACIHETHPRSPLRRLAQPSRPIRPLRVRRVETPSPKLRWGLDVMVASPFPPSWRCSPRRSRPHHAAGAGGARDPRPAGRLPRGPDRAALGDGGRRKCACERLPAPHRAVAFGAPVAVARLSWLTWLHRVLKFSVDAPSTPPWPAACSASKLWKARTRAGGLDHVCREPGQDWLQVPFYGEGLSASLLLEDVLGRRG
jgi:hypothetical protein